MRSVDCGSRRDGRFVHEQHFRVGGQRTSDAQPLLLPAGEFQGRLVEAVLDFVPKRGFSQRIFDHGFESSGVGQSRDSWAVDDVLEDRLGEWIGFLKHHADASPKVHQVHVTAINVLAVEQDRPFHASAIDQIVHTVEHAQERGFAAARRPDEGRDRPVRNREADIEESPGPSRTRKTGPRTSSLTAPLTAGDQRPPAPRSEMIAE